MSQQSEVGTDCFQIHPFLAFVFLCCEHAHFQNQVNNNFKEVTHQENHRLDKSFEGTNLQVDVMESKEIGYFRWNDVIG